ncbi:hypothetical protein KUTeg_021322 [Tegillarca granosa]|uniref:Cadherin domain-containing protein n=1 Tax=Tegillarca granosa TaxID=220873 RepID=A0ABQ9EFQ2_TEGGR|nr:hypothetical protein KUTeg_021322 [Tegillarca granosa]
MIHKETMYQVLTYLLLFVPLILPAESAYPVFTNPSTNYGTTVTINEDISIGTSIFQAVATDTDGHAITYTVTGGMLIFDGDILKTSARFDYETTQSHTIQLTATDSTSLATSIWMYISVTDVNDNPPLFTPAIYTATVAESTAAGQALVTLTCSDPDVSVNGACSLSIVAGDDATPKFSLSGSTIQTSANSLNYEAHSHRYVLRIEATETPSGSYTGTAYVLITVTAVNEFDPISEDYAVTSTTPICTVSATDLDTEPAGSLVYAITSGNINNVFGISYNNTAGYIYVVKALDYETRTSYSLVVQATDAASSPRSGTYNVPITITNVNDNTPVCSPKYQVSSFSETTSTGTTVATLSCSDGDSGTTLTYSFASGNTDATFSVTSGVVTNAKAVDYDAGTTSYTLLIRVSDGTYHTTATVVVSVMPVNDNSPTFSSNPTHTTAENTAINTVLITYTASDNDAAPHGIASYAINSVSNSGTNVFLINPSSGAIILAQSLDYETTQSFMITVVATDGGGTTVTGTVTISVTDVNDNTPSCTTNTHVLSVSETTSSTVISDLSCSDSDSGTNANLNYVLTTNPNNKFGIAQSGGVYSLQTQGTLDYETAPFYELLITITDGGTPALSTTVSVQVNILDVNEATPTFTSSGQYAVTVSETESIGSTLVTVSASDADTADDIEYAFQTTYSGFTLDKSTGKVFLTSSLDYESNPTHTLIITATDGSNTATATFSLTVTDVNEAPEFATKLYSQQINENEASGAAIVTVSATDGDSGSGGTITYSIASGDGTSSFYIDPNSGVITTTAVLDYETKYIYYLVIRAADGGSPSLSATCVVTVTVLDKNDNAPVFEPSSSFTTTISENSALSTGVITVIATDSDSSSGNNNVFEFSLASVHPFSIGTTTGVITTNTLLNREIAARLLIKDQSALTGTLTFTVSLADVNDNTPTITGSYDTTISEATEVNTVIFTITASDDDTGDNALLSYNITAGDDNQDFKTDNNIVQVAKTLDRETKAIYTLEITVSDNGATPRSASVSATVTISDFNEFTPTLNLNTTTFNISENVAIGTTVVNLSEDLNDPDSGSNSQITYTIAGYWTTGTLPFTLASSTGILTTNSALDRETLGEYGIWLKVADAGSPLLSSELNITITLADINDNSPTFVSSSYVGSVTEGTAAGTTVMTLVASDPDLDENAVIIYTINSSAIGGDKALENFNLDNASGSITTLIVPDRENISSFAFIVNAADNSTSSLTSSATVTITVIDLNDNQPIFSSTFYNTEVPYLVTCNSSITTLIATDLDTGNNALLTYYLVQSSSITFDTYFTLDNSSGQISLKSTVPTNSKYLMTFGVRDAGSPQQTSSVTVRIDTYTPDDIVIVFHMSISQSSYFSLESEFLSKLTSLYQQRYTTCIVRRWCIEEVTSSSIKVNIYVISEDTTNSESNTGTAKEYLQPLTIRDIVASTDGSPKSTITGTSVVGTSWDSFSITKVTMYKTESTSDSSTLWITTNEGIAVLSVCGFIFFVVVTIIVAIMVKKCNEPERPKTSLTSINDDESISVPDETGVREEIFELDDDLFELPAPKSAHFVNPAKRTYKQADDMESLGMYRKPVTKTETVDYKTTQATAAAGIPEKKQPIQPMVTVSDSPLPFRVDFSRLNTTRPAADNSQIQNAPDQPQQTKPVLNRKFDGRAIDPVTQKVFEYNTKTNERRWVTQEEMAEVDELDF